MYYYPKERNTAAKATATQLTHSPLLWSPQKHSCRIAAFYSTTFLLLWLRYTLGATFEG